MNPTVKATVAALIALLIAGSLQVPASGAGSAGPRAQPTYCADAPGPADRAEDFVGFRWKPAIVKRDTLGTMLPYNGSTLGYPDAASAAADLSAVAQVAQCANLVTIGLTPQRKLIKDGNGCDDDTPATICVTEDPECTDAEDAVGCWKDHQRRAVVEFIRSARASGLKFLLQTAINYDQPGGVGGRPPTMEAYADQIVADMVATLTLIDEAGLSDSVKGIMTGEHNHATTQQESLELALIIARRINDGTRDDRGRGFLQRDGKIMTFSGMGFGLKYQGIRAAVADTDFFRRIAEETSQFTFTVKFFLSRYAVQYTGLPGGVTIDNEEVMSAADWHEYLTTFTSDVQEPRLTELASLVRENRKAYPDHTGVIFQDDAGDGLNNLTHKIDPDAVAAIRRIFADQGWTGFVFGVPFEAQDVIGSDRPYCRGIWLRGDSSGAQSQLPHDAWLDWHDTMHHGQVPAERPGVRDWCLDN